MAISRSQYLSPVRTLVVKLGTQLLSDSAKRLDHHYLADIAGQVACLRSAKGGEKERKRDGKRVTIVSSGAVGAGMAELGLTRRPTDLAQLQAVAAIGQRRLMDAWAAAFDPHGIKVAQILLTREDIDNRSRFLNLRNTIHAIHELGAIPIINENDTVSTDEIVRISFGDNDILAALVAHALSAQLLVLLTVVDGLLDTEGNPVRLVENVEQARTLIRGGKSELGRGGMDSKLLAAQQITDAGDIMVVAHGRMEQVLAQILDGKEVGTLFVPSQRKRIGRNRWIGAARPKGAIVVDAGAAIAIVEKNRSLLPAGILALEDRFENGDLVAIKDPGGEVIAQGLTNYSSAQIEQIKGKKTVEVRQMLGDAAYEEVVHRDNLVL